MMESRPLAPRIARLAADLIRSAAESPRLIEAFWAEVGRSGTPLVEPADPGRSWVTFVWRAGMDDVGLEPPVEPVMVMGGPALWWQLPDNVLEPLADTDVRCRSYLVGDDLRGRYVFSPGDPLTDLPAAGTPESMTRAARFRADSRNNSPLVLAADPADPLANTVTYSTFALPAATPRSWAAPRPGTAGGHLDCHWVRSTALTNTRRVWIYRPTVMPAAASPVSTRHPVLLMLDGQDWVDSVSLVPTLDNLLADGLSPPVTVVLVDSLDTATRYRELTANSVFTGFLVDELIPWARNVVAWPSDPAEVALHGKSYGGLAALSAALRCPAAFGTVLSQSGSFWWSGGDGGTPEVVPASVAATERRGGGKVGGGTRVSLDIGTLEGKAMLGSHRRTVDALQAGGYPLRNHSYHGGHDINCWISELPAALRWWLGTERGSPDDPSDRSPR